jgi:hypothetical protein
MNKSVSRMNYIAIVAMALTAFLISSAWYSPLLFGKAWMQLRGVNPNTAEMSVPVGNILGELVRSNVVALVIERLSGFAGVADWKDAASFGLWLWIGFPATLLTGSVMWDNVAWQLASIHAGDWLVKILVIAIILGVWRR